MADQHARIRNINDLAKLAGVSTSTVSRALDNSHLISKATRERVQALAREHGYRPNMLARNLRTQRTGAIGIAIPLGHETRQHVSDPFFISMLGLLADQVTERGYDLLLSRVIPEDDEWIDKLVDSGRIDGLILIGQSNQLDVIERVAARYRPLVVWGGYVEGQVHCSVGTDNFTGGMLAAQHLIEKGCTRVTFLGNPDVIEIAQRLDGCRAALAAAGMDDMLTVVPAHLVAEQANVDVNSFLDTQLARPHGIFAASDVIAMSAIRALTDHGLVVPDDVHVVGFDGLQLSEHTQPRLTTIKQDVEAGARHLVDLLFSRIAGNDTKSVIMPPELIVRAST